MSKYLIKPCALQIKWSRLIIRNWCPITEHLCVAQKAIGHTSSLPLSRHTTRMAQLSSFQTSKELTLTHASANFTQTHCRVVSPSQQFNIIHHGVHLHMRYSQYVANLDCLPMQSHDRLLTFSQCSSLLWKDMRTSQCNAKTAETSAHTSTRDGNGSLSVLSLWSRSHSSLGRYGICEHYNPIFQLQILPLSELSVLSHGSLRLLCVASGDNRC